MALPILDGNQSATTLSTILSSGQHITAHTVISLGTQAITDMRGAVSGSVVSISNLPSTQTIAGTVTANLRSDLYDAPNDQYLNRSALHIFNGDWNYPVGEGNPLPISGSVTIGAGTAQIGSVTASISNSVTIASLPAISGTVTANTFAIQGTAVTTSNFTSTTASTVLANYNATREVLTIFNEGAGNLHIAPGATCTTIAYQVRLSSGDYYEVPNHQTTITHSAVFATAGTARIVQIS